jgi:hypothetical protein
MSDDKLEENAAPYCAEEFKSEFQPLIDELYREEVLDARRMPAEEKILAGQRLFDAACEVTLWGIRNEFPDFTEERCRQVLRERLVWRRRVENQHDNQ